MGLFGMSESELKKFAEELAKRETSLKNKAVDLESQGKVLEQGLASLQREREAFEAEKTAFNASSKSAQEQIVKDREQAMEQANALMESERKAFEEEKKAFAASSAKTLDKIAKEQAKLEARRQELLQLEAEAKNGFVTAQNDAFSEVFETRQRNLDEQKKALDAIIADTQERMRLAADKEGEIAKRELAVTEREQGAEAGFAQKAAALAAEAKKQHEENLAEAAQIAEKRNALKAFEEQLRQRDEAIRNAEQDRDNGYAAERAALDAELADKQKAFDEELLRKQQEAKERADRAVAEIAQYREDELKKIESEIASIREQRMKSVTEAENIERERIRTEIERSRQAFEDEKKATESALQLQRTELAKQKATLLSLESELAGQKQQLEQDAARLEKQEERNKRHFAHRNEVMDAEIAEKIQDAKESFDSQLRNCRQENQRLLDQLRIQTELLGAFEILKKQLGDQDPSEVILRLQSQTEELKELREKIKTGAIDGVQQRIETLNGAKRDLEKKVEELNKLIAANAQAISEVEALKLRNSDLETQNQVLSQRATLFEGQANQAMAELKRLREVYEQPAEVEARYKEIEAPYLTSDKVSRPKKPNDPAMVNELEWLTRISDSCDDIYGLHFNPRIVKAFHTALKIADWAPITVLAGVSGTGKSELPKLYSHFGGLIFEPLSVQPNWDSQESMLGFFNSIDNRFDAQPVLRFLAQSQKKWGPMTIEQIYAYHCSQIDAWAKDQGFDKNQANYIHESTQKWLSATNGAIPDYPGLRDAVCMILLDEMNLAHPELYFAEFLSKLELRRGYDSKHAPHLDVKVGAGNKPYELPLGRNVLWTGTMNQDETTKSLSDKVLDRSIIIYFPRPTELKSRKKQATLTEDNRGELLHRSIWEGWIERESTFEKDEILPFRRFLEEMNGSLGTVGRAIGHRVWQSVEYYMANYPDVRAAKASGDKDSLAQAMHTAFEDQLVQKVMPKLRGIDTRGDSAECLAAIRRQIIAGVNKRSFNLSVDFDLACKLGYGQFIWQSANYLRETQEEKNS